MKQTIYRWTGIPISIGLANTKTLAKLANKISKKFIENDGVYQIDDINDYKHTKYLEYLDIDDIWGIGGRIAKRLKIFDIADIPSLLKADRHLLRQEYGVMLERTWLELHSIRCYPINPHRSSKKGILCSRTFKKAYTEYNQVAQAVARFTDSAARSLRAQGSVTSRIWVFLTTDRFTPEGRYSNSYLIKLETPTDYTPLLTKSALNGLKQIFRTGYKYKRAGVFLENFYHKGEYQQSIFTTPNPQEDIKQTILMKSFDKLNSIWGKGTIKFANQMVFLNPIKEQVSRSPRYTTRWEEIPVIGN